MIEQVIEKYVARGVNFNIRTAVGYRDRAVRYIAEVNSEGHFDKEGQDSPRFKFRTSARDLTRLAVQVHEHLVRCEPLLDKCEAVAAEMAAVRTRGCGLKNDPVVEPNTDAATAMERPLA